MKKVLFAVLITGFLNVVSWASGVGGGYVNVYYSTSTAHNNFSNLAWSVAGHTLDINLVAPSGVTASSATITYNITAGSITTTGLIIAGSGAKVLTNATGNIDPAQLAAGSLPTTVIISSVPLADLQGFLGMPSLSK